MTEKTRADAARARFERVEEQGPGEGLPEAEAFDSDGGFWIFAYGSLIWQREFDCVDRRRAVLPGFRRAFCLWSMRYRGTPETPGLVLGLHPAAQAETHGVAFRVGPDTARDARRALHERELATAAYHERRVSVVFEDGGRAQALVYVSDMAHPQFADGLALETQAEIIARAEGGRGLNHEYLFNTVAHLREIGAPQHDLEELLALEARVRALLGPEER